MKKLTTFACLILFILCIGSSVQAGPFYAVTNEIGYSGTVTYTPIGETDPVVVSTSTPRDGYIYILNDAGTSDFNIFMSNWSEHSPSNVHDSFFQLYDENADSVTSATGYWNDSFTEFTVIITGENAAYTDDPLTNEWSRAWMPDQNVAARGNWVDYSLTLVASGMTVGIDDEWYVNITDPTSITGTFAGTFVSEARTYDSGLTTFENTYYVDLTLGSDLFDATSFTGEIENSFGTPVPEPSLLLLLGLGLGGVTLIARRSKK